jgi:hypothetical protein
MGMFDRHDRGQRGGYDYDARFGFRGHDPNDVERDRYGARGRHGYDRDVSPTEAGWRSGGRDDGWNARPEAARFDRENRWGSHPYDREMRGDGRGDDRGPMEKAGDSIRHGWHRLTGDDYDRGFRGRDAYDTGYSGRGRGGEHRQGARDDYRGEGGGGYGRGIGYEPGLPRERGRNDAYRSQHRTDTGDPFGDRQQRTPVRMVNEDYSDRLARGYDRQMRGQGAGRDRPYDADIRRDRDWF